MKITKRQLKRIIKEEITEAGHTSHGGATSRREPDGAWWSQAFWTVVEDNIGYGSPTPEQRAAIMDGLKLTMEEL